MGPWQLPVAVLLLLLLRLKVRLVIVAAPLLQPVRAAAGACYSWRFSKAKVRGAQVRRAPDHSGRINYLV